MTKKPKAVCQMGKVKSMGDLKAMADHHVRCRPTPNADPDGAILVLLGSGNPYEDARERLAAVEKPRQNAVLAVELVLSASPAYFRPDDPRAYGAFDLNRLRDFVTIVKKWGVERYGENLISMVLHCDEATPHVHCVVVPVLQGRLNCREMFSLRPRLIELQDSYAAALAPLGIQRGRRGSPATHEEIRHWYEAEPKRLATMRKELDARQVDAERLIEELEERLADVEVEARARLQQTFHP